jgi:hypothetical protein
MCFPTLNISGAKFRDKGFKLIVVLYVMARCKWASEHNVSPNVWCQNAGHSNSNVRYFKNFKFSTGIKRVSGLQNFKYLVISILKLKIKSPGLKIFILWDMGHVIHRLEAIVSKITRHKEITYYTPYFIVLRNSLT